MRATSLDELPQFLNVVLGDMSLVGPRPNLTFIVERYRPHYDRILRVRPGITSLVGIGGRNRLKRSQMIALDDEYVDTLSFRNDLRILLKTVPAVLFRHGATDDVSEEFLEDVTPVAGPTADAARSTSGTRRLDRSRRTREPAGPGARPERRRVGRGARAAAVAPARRLLHERLPPALAAQRRRPRLGRRLRDRRRPRALPVPAPPPERCCPGWATDFAGLDDISSAYGYGGPLVDAPAERRAQVLAAFRSAFGAWCAEDGIVSEFVRSHPLLHTEEGLADHMELLAANETVVCRLGTPDEHLAAMNSATRRNVRKAQRAGLQFAVEGGDAAYAAFLDLYLQTMRRRDAAAFYLFDERHLADFRELLGERQALLMVRHEGRPVAAALFMLSDCFAHYHLGGSDAAALELRPNNLLFFEAMNWAGRPRHQRAAPRRRLPRRRRRRALPLQGRLLAAALAVLPGPRDPPARRLRARAGPPRGRRPGSGRRLLPGLPDAAA